MKELTKAAKVITFFTNVLTFEVDLGGKVVISQGKKMRVGFRRQKEWQKCRESEKTSVKRWSLI